MSTPPTENPQNEPTETALSEMRFTFFVPPAPAIPQTEEQDALENDQDNNLSINDSLTTILAQAFTERQQAKKSYLEFNSHARIFYINLLIRPSWGRSPEHLRKAYTLGLIYPSFPSKRIELIMLDDEIDTDPVFEDNQHFATYSQHHMLYVDISACVKEAPPPPDPPVDYAVLLTTGSTVPDAEIGFHGYPIPHNFVPGTTLPASITPDLCLLHRHPEFANLIDILYPLVKWEFTVCANFIRISSDVLDLTVGPTRTEKIGLAYLHAIYSPAWQFHYHCRKKQNFVTRYPPHGYDPPPFLCNENSVPKPEEYITHVPCRGCFLSRIFEVHRLQNFCLLNKIMRPNRHEGLTENIAFEQMMKDICLALQMTRPLCIPENRKEFNVMYLERVLTSHYEHIINYDEEIKWDHGVTRWLAWMARQPDLPCSEESKENITTIDDWAATS